jgi:dTDP-4-amino-4,6-dideoxygalactose transaminase
VRSDDRDSLQAALAADGVQTATHYPVPVHLQPAYADLGYKAGDFPHSESAARQVLSLPLYPELQPEAVSKVTESLKQAAVKKNHTAMHG